MDARGSDDGSLFPKLQDYKKMNLPGENLGITLKINKWALLKETACNKMKPTTYPYHVVLAPKTKHKKKSNESGINYPGELKTLNSSRGHKISTRNGSVIVQV
jgi:hypothetical protein